MSAVEPTGSGPVTVRDALGAMRFSTAQVHGIVAHVIDDDPASSSLTLGSHWSVAGLTRIDPPISALECLRTTAPGVALEVLTYLRKEYGPRDSEVRMRTPSPDGWRTSFEVRRVPEPGAGDPVTVEYLIEVPPGTEMTSDERPTVGLAALQVIELVAAQGLDVVYVHAPASPPARRDEPCLAHGPCARVGVAVPRGQLSRMLDTTAELVRAVSQGGLHLWVRDTATPDAVYDAWRRLYPSGDAADTWPADPVAEAVETATTNAVVEGEPGKRLAITCVGPARRGVAAQLAQRFEAANSRVRAVSLVQLDELTVAHGVIDPDFVPVGHETSGVGDLDQLLGARPRPGPGPRPDGNSERNGLAGFKAFWSVLPPPPPALALDRRVLWMKWSIPTPHQLSLDVVTSAWRAVGDACRRWVPDGPWPDPRFDYVISRVRHGGLLQGRVKVVLDLDVIAGHAPIESGNGIWRRRFCAEIEDRWRTDLRTTLRARRADLIVGWSESWLDDRAVLQRGSVDVP